uniref:B-cell antigen receptor complex-associated protein beta chain n=1 Tax=Lutjanus sanguineus TaxID=264213 RepID=A0A0B5KEM1_9TELE|nr:B-cell antigen receptor complex-associated protein beta chain [Lutjanus sanguineus]
MRWLLAGYFGLALISISVAVQITQWPRFYGLNHGGSANFHCQLSKQDPAEHHQWYKAEHYNKAKVQIKADPRFEIHNSTRGCSLSIHELREEDNGVYFCKIKQAFGPGTELRVTRPFNRKQALYRTQMKDALIILQGLLLAVYIAAVLLRKRTLSEKTDSIYEEPETDHIYEGLTIETCGGGLYEELSVYAQAEGAEAPWE